MQIPEVSNLQQFSVSPLRWVRWQDNFLKPADYLGLAFSLPCSTCPHLCRPYTPASFPRLHIRNACKSVTFGIHGRLGHHSCQSCKRGGLMNFELFQVNEQIHLRV